MKTVTVTLPSGAYDILIGQGLLKQAGQLAAKVLAPCKAAVITDDKVAALYGEDFCQSLLLLLLQFS